MRMVSALLAGVLTMPATSLAADIESLKVAHVRGEYRVVFHAVLAAPPGRVHEVLADFTRWPELSDLIKESEVVEVAGPDRALVRVVTSGCIAFFCKEFEQVQWMTVSPGRIDAVVLPERSDLKYGWSQSTFAPLGESTHMSYEMVLAPSFWVPPLIGPMLIQRKLRKQSVETAELVERLAAGGT